MILKVFGLTGGPGCGKSTVSRFFSATRQWQVVDADAVCHDLYAKPEPALADGLRRLFGPSVLSPEGAVDRKTLAACVLSSSDRLHALNELVHPFIFKEVRARIRQFASEPMTSLHGILLDAPLLFETGMDSLTPSGVIAVWTDPATQQERLLARGWSKADLAARIAGQLPASEKLALADFGLVSRGDFSFLYEQCKRLMNFLTYQI